MNFLSYPSIQQSLLGKAPWLWGFFWFPIISPAHIINHQQGQMVSVSTHNSLCLGHAWSWTHTQICRTFPEKKQLCTVWHFSSSNSFCYLTSLKNVLCSLCFFLSYSECCLQWPTIAYLEEKNPNINSYFQSPLEPAFWVFFSFLAILILLVILSSLMVLNSVYALMPAKVIYPTQKPLPWLHTHVPNCYLPFPLEYLRYFTLKNVHKLKS